jgi:DNA polymerase-4
MRAGLRRSILHVDLDAFFVGVERSSDPTLRGQPVVVGGDGRSGVVAAASSEARAAGVRVGMSLAAARRACPQAVLKPGDLDAYARVSEQVTGILLAASRRVERPSADEAYVDLTAERPAGVAPVPAAERIKDELQRRLGLDASLGLASSRLAARVASGWARPRGLLIVLPGYEASFLARQPASALEGLPPHLEVALERAGLLCLGDILAASPAQLREALGPAAEAVRRAASGEDDELIAVAAPPAWLQEEATVRDARTDRQGLEIMLRGLAERICRRLRPHGLRAETLAVEVRRAGKTARRVAEIPGGVADENGCLEVAVPLAAALLDPAPGVQGLSLRLSRLTKGAAQAPLFPERPGLAGRR